MPDLVWTLPEQPNQTARWEEPSGGGSLPDWFQVGPEEGTVIITGLPTDDPLVAGQLYLSGGLLVVSEG